ncbi:MAG: hypothetical protein AB7U76_24410 [Pirellulales bacterium]
MNLRHATGHEMLIAHDLWGANLYPALKDTRIVDAYFSGEAAQWLVERYSFQPPPADFPMPEEWEERCCCVVDDNSHLRFIFLPREHKLLLPAWAHEFGHAVCDYRYPESRQWSTEKLEAFACLSDVNYEKHPVKEDPEEWQFRAHLAAMEADPLYRGPLQRARSLRMLKLNEQCEHIARDLKAPSDQVPLDDAGAVEEF